MCKGARNWSVYGALVFPFLWLFEGDGALGVAGTIGDIHFGKKPIGVCLVGRRPSLGETLSLVEIGQR